MFVGARFGVCFIVEPSANKLLDAELFKLYLVFRELRLRRKHFNLILFLMTFQQLLKI